MSRQNGTMSSAIETSGVMEELDDTNCWNLRQISLDGKAILGWYDADIVLADLNNIEESIICTWRFGSLDSTSELVSTTSSKASAELFRSLRNPFLSRASGNLF